MRRTTPAHVEPRRTVSWLYRVATPAIFCGSLDVVETTRARISQSDQGFLFVKLGARFVRMVIFGFFLNSIMTSL